MNNYDLNCSLHSLTLLKLLFFFFHRKKLFGCLQTPFLEMRNMIRPPPSPMHGEGESLSEWFCHMGESIGTQSDCSSVSVPLAELSISYVDDDSDTSSNYYYRCHDKEESEFLSQVNCNSFRGTLTKKN